MKYFQIDIMSENVEPSAPPPYTLSEENEFLRREIEGLKIDMNLMVQASVAVTGFRVNFIGLFCDFRNRKYV